MNSLPLLSIIVFAPWVGALVLALLPRLPVGAVRGLALVFSLSTLGLGIRALTGFDAANTAMQFAEKHAWISALNVHYHLGLDGLSLVLVLLTGLIAPVALFGTVRAARQPALYAALFLFLQGSALGVFLALDFFPWFIFWELSLVPAFFLVKMWGGPGATRAAYQFVIYTIGGSAFMLLGFAALYASTGTLNFVERVQATRAGGSFFNGILCQPGSFFGMHTAHVGVAVFVVGVTMVSSYQEEKDVKMGPGETVSVAGYEFRFNGVKEVRGPNYTALAGDFDLVKDSKVLRKMQPEKRTYVSSAMPMTEAAIDTGVFRDLYVSLGEPIDRDKPEGEWAVRVYHKPFVDWIWGGCVLMSIGGLIAILDRRYRVKARASSNLTSGNTQTA